MPVRPSEKPAKGFSLVETLFALGLVVLIFALGILNLRNPTSGAGSKGVAQLLAAQLTDARQRALSQHTTVAVVVPSASGSRPYADGLYAMAGDSAPRIYRAINLAREFPRAYVAVASWAGPATPATVDSPIRQSSPSSRFDLATWLSGADGYQARDFVICFTPDGKVHTNDLPWTNGQLRLVTCSGLEFQSTTFGGTPVTGSNTAGQFELTRVYQAHTVTVTQEGSVWTSPGLVEATPTVMALTPVSSAVPPASAPNLTASANHNPTVLRVEAFPVADSAVPGGYNSIIPPNGFVTLVVRVLDEDAGDPLCCKFSASAVGGGASGTFSQGSDFVRMNWDPQDTGAGYPNGCWKATWVWTPPDDPQDPRYDPPTGSVFEITGEVIDSHGGSVTFGGGAGVISLQVVNRGKVVFSARYQGRQQLFCMSPETRSASVLPITVSGAGNLHAPSVSPDGKQLLYVNSTGTSHGVYLCNIDGSNNQLLHQQATAINHLTWSPDATRYMFDDATGLHVAKLTPGASPTGALVAGSQPCWNDLASQSWVVYVNPARDIELLNPSTSATIPVTSDGSTQNYSLPSFNEGSTAIYYKDGSNQIHQVDLTYSGGVPTPAAPKLVGNIPPGVISPLRFTGNPPKVVMSTVTGLTLADYVNGANPTFVQNLGFQIDAPAYTSNWDEVNWSR